MNMKMLRLAALSAMAWLVSMPLQAAVEGTGPETGSKPNNIQDVSGPGSGTSSKSGGAAREKKRDTYPFNGTIAEVDVTARTVTLKGKGAKRVISLTDQTRLLKQGQQQAAMDDLKVGERVGGTLRKNSAGKEEALLVRIGTKSDGTPSASTSPPASGTTGSAAGAGSP